MDALEIAKRLDLKQNVTIRVIDEYTGKEKILFHEQLYKAGDQLNHLLPLKVKILAPHTDYHVNILLMKRFSRS